MTEFEEERVKKESLELAASLLESGVPGSAQLIYDGRNKLYVHTLPCGKRVNIKAFKRQGWFRGMVYALFTRPKSVKSYRNSKKLKALGFRVAEPLAHSEERLWGGLRLGRAYYVSEQLENYHETRNWETWDGAEGLPDKERLCDALGAEMTRLYRAGVLFRDFSPGNVLVDSELNFAYVDVNRTDFGVRSRRKMMTMFKRINIVPAETARLARAFAKEMGWDVAVTEAEALEVLRRFLWWKDTFWRTLKNLIK